MDILSLIQQQLGNSLQEAPETFKNAESGLNAGYDTSIGAVTGGLNSIKGMNYDTGIGGLSAASGMLAPTKTGGFGESMGNAFGALADDRLREQNFNLDKAEKLSRMGDAIGNLQRGKATVGVDSLKGRMDIGTSALGNMQNMQQYKYNQSADPYRLNALRRADEMAQADVNFIPPPSDYSLDENGNFDMRQSAISIIQDYQQNPKKYAGPQGQAMLRNATDLMKQERSVDREVEIANLRAQGNGKLDVGTMKAIRDIDTEAQNARAALNEMNGIEDVLRDSTYGPMGSVRLQMMSWGGDKKAANALAALDQMTLKGYEKMAPLLKPLSDGDKKTVQEVFGNPNSSVEQKLKVVRILKHGFAMTEAYNKEISRAMRSRDYYKEGYNPMDNEELAKLFEGTDLYGADESKAGHEVAAPPEVGAVDGGYVFKGGDPSDEKNWEKAE